MRRPFDRLVAEGVPRLIVDLRRNEGGEDCGDALVARLADRPIVADPAGRLDVLIGPQNSSATFAFAQMVQRERLGRLIGEPTGGNRRGINGGCFYFMRLPETGLEVDLPLIDTFPTTPQPDGGVVPGVAVPRTAAAIAVGRDDVMARALAG